ncbi:adenosylcobinamide-GDP ribazoletransferase [Pararobbsia alpina]|uniref:Adenosylcobinamide-GDP ribazoletransferase n=1 Tax=Pararobbsia alpina TaxID=621374 RepID=A0A6S7AUP9_9BURK|nr:adenosylcobinamide-GDP ribazoletransferase [Pararobbsia alpina]CAB3776206.1 Adenosylcobinamide-GDP ribazoletransferase [Pararobbsia alpina]
MPAKADPRSLAHRVLDEVRYLLTALGYFTRVPVPRWVGFEPHYLPAAARWFALVGVLVGTVAALVFAIAIRVFPQPVAVLLSMAATLLLTGAFHEDGLADSCDAFGGAYAREDVLRIMHDSRIGVFGAIGLVVALLLKWQTLAALSPMRVVWVSIAAHAASRAVAISFLATHEYVRSEGKAKAVARRLGRPALVWVALTGLPWLFLPDWRLGLATLGVLAVLRFGLGRWFKRRIGGYTGDCLGFAQQVFEVAIYLCALASQAV